MIFGISVAEAVGGIVAVTGLIGIFVTMRKNRNDNRAALATIRAEREEALAAVAQKGEEIKLANDKAIDVRMKEELARAYREIDTLRQKVEKLEAEPDKIKAVVRRFIFTLHEWARVNGYTDIPWPSDDDMAVMAPEMIEAGISITKPKAEVRQDVHDAGLG